MKAKREWCCTKRTYLRTDKKKIRCDKCGRLLKVETPDEYDSDIQCIAAHKGKYTANRQAQRVTRKEVRGETRQVYSVRTSQSSRKT